MKKTALIAAAFSTSLVAAAGTLAAQETIKIGGIAPLSPPGGVQTGESLRDGRIRRSPSRHPIDRPTTSQI